MVPEGESSTAAGDSGAATATPTPAMAQAADQGDVAEQTPEVTLTEAAGAAATPTPSPLPPTALPPSATPRPTNTASPTATPTESSGAAVDYFRANVEEADPGDTITLEWATWGAETVTLWRLMATGQLGEFWDVAETGSFVYQIPEHARNWTTFALAVTEADGSTDMVTLEIGLRCPDRWYFDNPPDICPARAAVVSAGAEQHFQGGVMLWSAGEDRIYVLYGDGQSPNWAAFTDEWDPGEPESDPTLEPPNGLYQPVRGFGQVWREQPGVRERLGWALGEEVAYQTAVQRTSYAKYNETFIRAMDGGVWRLKAERSGWEKM